jgi:hypothetical protein
MANQESEPLNLSRFGPLGFGVGIIGLAIWLIATFAGLGGATTVVAMQSYHFAFVFWMTMTLGCLGLTLLHHSTRAAWSLPLLRMWEAGGGPIALVVMGLLFLPIAFGLPYIFEWARPEAAQDHVLHLKAPYLNAPFFLIRAVLFFAIWIFWAGLLRASSVRQDKSLNEREATFRTNFGTPGILVLVLTVTFAFTDWGMSLEPHWFSTIYGIWFIIGMILLAMAFCVLILTTNAHRLPFREVVSPGLMRDHGNLLLAFTAFWAYISLSQFLITWAADLPEYIPYYVSRLQPGWDTLGVIIIVLHFFVPFVALLSSRTKRVTKMLAGVAALLLVMRLLDMYWIIMPAFHGRREGLLPSLGAYWWIDLVAFIGIGGIWFGIFATQLAKAAFFPSHDVRLRGVAEHHA